MGFRGGLLHDPDDDRADGGADTGWVGVSSADGGGMGVCLPGGARTTRFGYGDDLSGAALTNYAWYFGNANTTHPVEQKLANPWGLMDMHGNV